MNSNHVLIRYTLSFEGFQLSDLLGLSPSDFVRKLLKVDSDCYEVTRSDNFFLVRKPLNKTRKPADLESFEKDFLDSAMTCTTDSVTARFLNPVRCSFVFLVHSEDEFSIETHSYRRVGTSVGTNWEIE